MVWMALLMTDAPLFFSRMWGKRWFRWTFWLFLFIAISSFFRE